MLEQRGTDYGAMIIKGSAGIVITVSLALIFLVIGNMVYQTFTRKVVFCEKRKH
uniref:Col_cuticle_N domain-containing protein n=1 Tax=Loa loa TaxID=7209 RepID=A0A1I7VIV9_LOALO